MSVRKVGRAGALVFLVGSLAWTPGAAGQGLGEEPGDPVPIGVRLMGGTVSGGADLEGPYPSGIVYGGEITMVLHPILATSFGFSRLKMDCEDLVCDDVTLTFRSAHGAFTGRATMVPYVTPWVSVGFQWLSFVQEGTATDPEREIEFDTTRKVAPFYAAGIDYSINNLFSVSLGARFSKATIKTELGQDTGPLPVDDFRDLDVQLQSISLGIHVNPRFDKGR